MSARTDALVSRAETGKMSLAFIVPRCVRLSPGGALVNAASTSWFGGYTAID
jgi:hypothetical protein